ncbi:MAG: hypothetical protein GKS05_03880 [Nitrospirales bacterium]|nr:hypothetical protein [Nitrospirales bacterium]
MHSQGNTYLQTIPSILFCLFIFVLGGPVTSVAQAMPGSNPLNPWPALIREAEALGLPTQFLKEIDPEFVTVEFADLHTYAAEYHPEDHRMILNLRLSFNKAGGALAALDRMTHHDLNLLYHELLHAYLDFIFFGREADRLTPQAKHLLAFAQKQLQCHYRFIRITPIRQRKASTELRFLSDDDAWEALNETWAMFVGWAIWTKLELFPDKQTFGQWTPQHREQWGDRLAQADRQGEILGYYEPDDPVERNIARKRFLAPSHGITIQGIQLLLETILSESPDIVAKSKAIINTTRETVEKPLSCGES